MGELFGAADGHRDGAEGHQLALFPAANPAS